MRIWKMRATFGCLEGKTLTLSPGLNWIVAPNEWGKSTWCAFLCAMLYGIDTRERSGKDTLATKERYAPWSGKPMEGVLEIEHNGRRITIQRTTQGRVPLGTFRAFETDTGLPVRELTAHNCGEVLLDVERSVFLRSGFVRLEEMPVTPDEALRRRLNDLVTSGDESGAADRLGQTLKELKNRCRYNRTGLIPQTQARLEELRQSLHQRQSLEAQLAALTEKETDTDNAIDQLELHCRWLQYRRSKTGREELEHAQRQEEAAAQELERYIQRCRNHPSRQELEELLSTQPAKQADMLPVLILAVAAVAATIVLDVMQQWPWALGTGILAVVILWLCSRRKVSNTRGLTQAQQWLSALEDWNCLEQWRSQMLEARRYTQILSAVVEEQPRPDKLDPLDLTWEESLTELEALNKKRGQYRQLRGECLGKMEQLPQCEDLSRQIQQTQLRLQDLLQTETALSYAQKALEEARESLQRRFAPRITRRAQDYLSRMTGGKYDSLNISQEFALTAGSRDELTQRSSLWRSSGTGDQMYLALRMAVWQELMPQGPLVLDDALARFDTQRLADTRALLEELSAEHQIIVFCCR